MVGMRWLWVAQLLAGTPTGVAPSDSKMMNSGTPPGIPENTDCAIRQLAWEYGRKLQPTRGAFKDLYDALQLGACDVPLPPGEHLDAWEAARQPRTPAGALELLVDPRAGDDGGDHSTTPFASISAAVDAAIATRAPGQAAHIVLRSGTHFVSETIQLTSAHSRLTIRNMDGEEAVISGGVNLTQPWKPSSRCTGCFEMDLSKQKNIQQVHGLRRDGIREIRARYPNFDPELDSTIDGQRHFHGPRDGWIAGHYNKTDKTQWIPLETQWIPSTSGTMNGISGWPPKDPATTFVIRDLDWPGVDWPMNITTNSTVDPDTWTGEGEWGEYWLGAGGTCADRSPPVGYWCAPAAPRGISTPDHPSGMSFGAALLPNAGPKGYKNATGAVIHAWRPGHWYTNIFEVGAWTAPSASNTNANTSFMFSRGGTQGGEGFTGGASEGPYGSPGWYIENVEEELDMGREWFFDDRDQTLIYKPNGTATPTGNFVATSLKILFNISGTKQDPAHHIAITGVTLRDTAYTYFDPHGLPSGGDWGLQQQGAITVVGSEAITIDKCLLTRLDGNAIFIGGYNRNLSITNNELSFIGDSAIAAWGDTSAALNANGSLVVPGGFKVGPDGRGGEQPRGTVVSNNICHEIGLWQKQSSMWFQAVTAQTVLKDNIFFNGPRAAFNFNDGFGGGDDISGNLLLNCVRESSDHGPWNSWSRVPYITDIRTGKPSIIPATRRIHNNFILATYFSQQAIDTDDGSAYYEVYDNFFAYGDNGLKSDFGGHDNVWHGNVLAYVGNCYTIFNFKGYNDAFYDNKCVFRTGYTSTCGLESSTGFAVHGNSVFSESGELTVCKTTWANWTATGHDTGTTLAKWPADAAVVAMGKTVLGMM